MEEEEEEDSLPQISKYNKIKEKEKKKKTSTDTPSTASWRKDEGMCSSAVCLKYHPRERERKKNRFCVASRRGIRIT